MKAPAPPMSFALDAATRVTFHGERHLHAFIAHAFGGGGGGGGASPPSIGAPCDVCVDVDDVVCVPPALSISCWSRVHGIALAPVSGVHAVVPAYLPSYGTSWPARRR